MSSADTVCGHASIKWIRHLISLDISLKSNAGSVSVRTKPLPASLSMARDAVSKSAASKIRMPSIPPLRPQLLVDL